MTLYLKAIYAAIITGLGTAGSSYVTSHGHIGWLGGIYIASATVTAFGVVWGVPNYATPSTPAK